MLLLTLAAVFLSSCTQLMQQEQPAKEEKPQFVPPLHIGAVHQVFATDKFALLRIIGPMPTEGTVLITHPIDGTADRVGNLIVSSAQHARNNIIAADIRAGVVMKGDRVFLYRNIAAEQAQEETEEPEPMTLTGEDLDLGYKPPRHELEKKTPAQPVADEEQSIQNPEPLVREQVEQEEEEATLPEPPAIPSSPGLPKFDDIPDTISGWDSF